MLIIAIAGGSGSGKTSVAEQLHLAMSNAEYSCFILCEDNYYFSLSQQQLENLSSVNFDHPDALNHQQLQQDLYHLKQGNSIQTPTYCYKTHQQLPETKALSPVDVLILEGLHLLHREALLPLYDGSVFVNTPTEVRLARRMERDVKERQRTPESVQQQFNQTVEPSHQAFIQPSKTNAELVVDGTEPLGEIVPVVIDAVLRKLVH